METQNDAPDKTKEHLRARDKLAYNVKEAAAALGVSPWYIRDEMAHGNLAYCCPRGRKMIPRWELVRYLKSSIEEVQHG